MSEPRQPVMYTASDVRKIEAWWVQHCRRYRERGDLWRKRSFWLVWSLAYQHARSSR